VDTKCLGSTGPESSVPAGGGLLGLLSEDAWHLLALPWSLPGLVKFSSGPSKPGAVVDHLSPVAIESLLRQIPECPVSRGASSG
jgi:hypothetical protein